ncbi:MAG: HNH endonuclease [Reichenbachiella sp.]
MNNIEDYPNYMVTREGEVINTNTSRVLKQEENSCRYLRVTVCKNNKPKRFFVHRLVAIAYVPNPDGLPQVNHLDGDKQNNNVENLEWCTQSINQYHAHSNNLQKRFTKVNEYQVRVICDFIVSNYKPKDISELCDVSIHIVSDIKRGKTWKHISKDYF